MVRLFNTHIRRETIDLTGVWDFEAQGKKALMPVPGCWEMHPDFYTYRGKALYTKKITLPGASPVSHPRKLRLAFEGVSHSARVLLDGKPLGGHYNAYTPFECIAEQVSPGVHMLTVEVDNSFDERSALHVPNDYFTYGGIIRPVTAEWLPEAYISRLVCKTRRVNGAWTLTTHAYVRGCGLTTTLQLTVAEQSAAVIEMSKTSESMEIPMVLDKQEILNNSVSPQSDETIFTHTAVFDQVDEWRPDNPALYTIRVELLDNGVMMDDLIERVGFREVSLDNRNLLLNGKPMVVKGVNRHEEHGLFGAAIPFAAMVQDIQLIKDMNANLVRTCHYPNDALWLDLCDAYGLLVWEEGHARGLSEEQMRHPFFDTQSADCLREMVENHVNHPSVVMWGVLNECASDTPYGRLCYEKQLRQLRTLDDTRPVTFASCRVLTDICLDLVDIVSFNLYAGWYNDCETRPFLDKLLAWSDENGGGGKPFLVSEFGAGGVYGFRDPRAVKWSEERQQAVLADNITVYSAHERLAGMIIWQFCDGRVSDEWFNNRPRTRNNKGIVDEYRRPKLAYHTVKDLFGQLNDR